MPVCYEEDSLVPLRGNHLEQTPEFILCKEVDHALFSPFDVLSSACPDNGRWSLTVVGARAGWFLLRFHIPQNSCSVEFRPAPALKTQREPLYESRAFFIVIVN